MIEGARSGCWCSLTDSLLKDCAGFNAGGSLFTCDRERGCLPSELLVDSPEFDLGELLRAAATEPSAATSPPVSPRRPRRVFIRSDALRTTHALTQASLLFVLPRAPCEHRDSSSSAQQQQPACSDDVEDEQRRYGDVLQLERADSADWHTRITAALEGANGFMSLC